MRKLLLSWLIISGGISSNAQGIISTFDTLLLSNTDTFYVNYSSPGFDVGFNDGFTHFPCYYDTAWGGLWSSGFAFSNMTDSTTSGYLNQYAAKSAIGYNNSANYAVYWQGYGANNKIKFMPADGHRPQGFYITNSTFAYNSMRDGDFVAKKFGGLTGSDPDWFKLTIYGYRNGALADSVLHYLADFRFTDSTQDYIQKDWEWVNLQLLGFADSVDFVLASSDVGTFGMNTPAYFCMDNFAVLPVFLSVSDAKVPLAKVFPNPTTDVVHIEMEDKVFNKAIMKDMTGRMLSQHEIKNKLTSLSTRHLPRGTYLLQLSNGNSHASVRFIKK